MLHLLQVLLHFDQWLAVFMREYGAWVYLGLFLIIFTETGLVIMPVLPGDSMLFVCGTLAGAGHMSLAVLIPSLLLAAVLGDALNYGIGRRFGPALFSGRWRLQAKHLASTEAFYHRHGGKAVVIGRFLPIIRTFVPFVAGIARMPRLRFSAFNLLGALLWVAGLLLAGYFLGRLPWVKAYLTPFLLLIIVLSLLPALFAWLQQRRPVSG
ncbi:VTT domain-containing protein [Candidatus Igneacidithiobacillus taiwanensis]|uniref:VTT domain-containing protein n=1 Tax=Candidatus Igneacidithiobacillus taiwanensis TaxID=1945924 RepID=UPI00289DEE8E|nr:VTT domain-containing protein [Candidatus Igneacidithiobacillus taiwanensis]